MPPLSAEARNLNWLVGNFVKNTPGVAPAMVVSADGLPLAVSERLERAKADQLAAIASGLASLSQGTARCFDVGLVKQTVVEMQRGLLFVTSISDGSCLTVLAASSCDLGVVAYQMAVLVTRAGDVLTPTLRAELQAALPGMNAQRLAGGRSVIGVAVEHPARAGNRQHASRACVTGPGEAAP
jgi:predicted regulator of Ras-like GTPase activity (Roadblock/LC7/MglB family)